MSKIFVVSQYIPYEGNYFHHYFLSEENAEKFLRQQADIHGTWELEEAETDD